MMKKRYAVLLLAAVLLFTCSCVHTSGGTSPGSNASSLLPGAKPEAKGLSISEIVSEEGTFTDRWEYECSYSYHVPQLDANTLDAANINDTIKMSYEEIVATSMESIKQNIMPDYADIGWESYQNGSVLSLVIKTSTYYGNREDYQVFNYDVETGTQLFTPDILEIKGISEDAYYQALRRTVIQYYDDSSFDYFSEVDDPYRAYYAERRSWTCSNDNIVGQQQLYLNANGDIASIVPVGYFAEVDYINQIFTVDLDEQSADMEDSYQKLFSAAIENGELTVYYLGEGETAPSSPRGIPHPVRGMYSNYTQMRCGVMGETEDSFVFLLTDKGRVEFVDVNMGSYFGYFIGSGPVLGLQDIVSLETATADDGFETVVAVDGNSKKIDLAPFVQEHEQSINESLLTDWTTYITYETDGGGSYEDFCSLEIFGWDQAKLQMLNSDAGTDFYYTGRLIFLGMSEDGSVYAYHFKDENGRIKYEGVASLFCEFSGGIDEFSNHLFWKDLSDTSIISTVVGEEVIFTEAFG